MGSNHHDDEMFLNKKGPKNPIKFELNLNDEQKVAKECIIRNPITVLNGNAGSGKTLVAVQAALDMLFTKKVGKILITRPTVSKDEMGFLPGDLKEKMDPWLAPIYHNLYALYSRSKIDKEIEQNNIEITPFNFMRGRTFLNSFVIVDEAQNVTHSQMKLVLSRLGRGSKMAICGDISQVDLKNKSHTGFNFLNKVERHVEGVSSVTLKKNHRHPIVPDILNIYDDYVNAE